MKKNIWIFSAIISSTLGYSSITHAQQEFAKKVGNIQAINGEIIFSVIAAEESATPACFDGQLHIPSNQAGKDQMLSLLITAKTAQRTVSVNFTAASPFACNATSVSMH